MGQHALVTGAAGFVGSHVVAHLEDRGWDVTPLDLPGRAKISGFPDAAADVVVSLAATADPGHALADPAAAYANGVRVMAQTMEYARRVGARVLHVSTNEVYGSRIGPQYAPRGPYAGAKACQEIVCAAYPDVRRTIIVAQSLFGERQQPNKLVPTAVRRILDGTPIALQRNGVRWAHRPLLHVRNLAEVIAMLAADPLDVRRIHVGALESLSVREVVAVIEDALDRRAVIDPVPAGDRPGHELDVEPIGCDLPGWYPSYETVPALRDVARWYRDQPS